MKNKIILATLISVNTLWAGFNFGECSGSGTFEQQINHYGGDYESAITVGAIPAGIKGLRVELISEKDVDIRLYGSDASKIVHWPYGILGKSFEETKLYNDVSVHYSGYNGVDGEKGHEFIEITESTPELLTMKAFGYQAGYATVNYSWTGKVDCVTPETGSGNFIQSVEQNKTLLVGTIPPNIKDIEINLIAQNDIDIQLYGADGTPIVAWPNGILSDSGFHHITYKGMEIEWSGYNGVDGNAGHEFIKVVGQSTEMLVMKVFGYAAGEAEVSYSWGALNYGSFPPSTTFTTRVTDTSMLAPTVGQYVLDNVFGTKITKVNKSDDYTASYPKVQSWNRDMTLLRVGSRLYDANTLNETNITVGQTGGEAYSTLCSRASDYFRWSNKVSNRFFVMNSSYAFVQGEIVGNTVTCTILDNLNEYELVHIGPHEGNIDYDDKYVVFVAKKPDDTTFYVILYDIENHARVWTKTMPTQTWEWVTVNGSSFWKPTTLDWLSVSPSGKYIVFNNDNGYTDGMYRYDINLSNKTKLQYRWDGDGNLYSEGGHGDIGYDTEGNEVFVQFVSGVGVYSFNLDNPSQLGKELLHSPYGGGHISCRNSRRSGWCYVTTKAEGHKEVFALKLDGTGDENVQRFSQAHSNDGYHDIYGAPSPDGTKMIFNSHWGSANEGTFIVEAQ